jgi:hypothetical protein
MSDTTLDDLLERIITHANEAQGRDVDDNWIDYDLTQIVATCDEIQELLHKLRDKSDQ